MVKHVDKAGIITLVKHFDKAGIITLVKHFDKAAIITLVKHFDKAGIITLVRDFQTFPGIYSLFNFTALENIVRPHFNLEQVGIATLNAVEPCGMNIATSKL